MVITHTQPLFVVSNHHFACSGSPPIVDGDTPKTYHSYFENRYGEQLIFAYSYETRQGVLWHGDAGWEQAYPVVDGNVTDLVLTVEEQLWLQICWQAAHRAK
jgi:hypothetical protein